MDVVARVQAAIDDGTAWQSHDFGALALSLVREKRCHLPPGVVDMWLKDDGAYEPVRSEEERSRRIGELLKTLPETCRRVQQAKARVDFVSTHQKELVTLRTEEVLGEPVDPVLAAIGAGLVVFVALVWFVRSGTAGVVALVAAGLCHARQVHRRRQHRLRAQAKVAELLNTYIQ
jgi:hypothetical protein